MDGRSRLTKEQLSRLATATIRTATTMEDRAFQINSQIVSAFELLIKTEHQRVLWPATLHLSQDYFASLQKHAVPLDEMALGQVLAFYPRAKVMGDDRGLTLRNSPPPIAKKRFPVHNPPE